jgi:hypothetical protein
MRKPIPEAPGYSISDEGVVYGKITGAPLKPWVGSHGYKMVRLRIDGKGFTRLVHRLVLSAFVGEPSTGQEACHANGDRLDCALDNLRWDTRSANAVDRYSHGHVLSTASRAKISSANKGRPLTKEHRMKLSLAKIGNKNRLGGKKYLELS